jgi:hypothetical protein
LETIVSPDGRREDGTVSISYDNPNYSLGVTKYRRELPNDFPDRKSASGTPFREINNDAEKNKILL